MFFSKIFTAVVAVAFAAVSVGAAPVPMPMAVARRGEPQAVKALEVLPLTHRKRQDINTLPDTIASKSTPEGGIIPFAARSESGSEAALVERDVNVQDPAMSIGDGIVPFKNPGSFKARSVEVEERAEEVPIEKRDDNINWFPSHIASRSDGHGGIVAF